MRTFILLKFISPDRSLSPTKQAWGTRRKVTTCQKKFSIIFA